MEWTPVPLFTNEVSPIPMDQARCWCDKNLVGCDINECEEFIPVLCSCFEINEDDLHLAVRDQFNDMKSFSWVTIEHWVDVSEDLSTSVLLTSYSTRGAKVDSLFLWLVSISL